MINEFATDIDGTIDHLEYLADLGINCLELMPLSNIEKRVDWGYMPRLHVHRPPAVTLNETPEEFHISTGLCQKI